MKQYVNVKEEVFTEIDYDYYGESPREWDNLWNLYTFERNYNSPDGHGYGSFNDLLYDYFEENIASKLSIDNYSSGSEHFKTLNKYFDNIGYLIAPINRYEHGLVKYSIGTGSGFDSGVVGIALVSHKDIMKEYSTDATAPINQSYKNKALRLLKGELETYTDYANGHVYTVSLRDFHGNFIDGLGGMMGYDSELDMIKEFIDYHTQYNFNDFDLMELKERITYEYYV